MQELVNGCTHESTVCDYENGEEICTSCGMVVDILESSDPGVYIKEMMNEFSDTHPHILSNDFNASLTSSVIANKNIDHSGQVIKNQSDYRRLRYYNKVIIASCSEKTLRIALDNITMVCDKLSIPQFVKNRAFDIYSKAYTQKKIKGRSILGCSMASLLYACKENDINRTIKDISFVIDDDPESKFSSELFGSYRLITESLELKPIVSSNPIPEINSIANKVGISNKSIKKAIELYKVLKELDSTMLSGKSPSAIAVCVLYLATKYNDELIRQADITDAADISTVTLRKRCDDFINKLKQNDYEMPKEMFTANTPKYRGIYINKQKEKEKDIDTESIIETDVISTFKLN